MSRRSIIIAVKPGIFRSLLEAILSRSIVPILRQMEDKPPELA
jgi:hypothetical protein